MRLKSFYDNARNSGAIFPLSKLTLVKSDVLALEFAHFFNLIEVNYKALLISMAQLDAFTAEDGSMIRTIEVHYAHVVRDAQFVIWNTFLSSLIKVYWTK